MGAVGYKLSFKNDSGEDLSIGFATDTGIITDEMVENLTGCFATVIESNHDTEMLRSGPYSYDLKQRIRSRQGHLSNIECAVLASGLREGGTKHILLAHLSEENNTPELAYGEVFSALADENFDLKVASQDSAVWLIGEK
jgi:phosphoribosyl 1,2-cyclic phosphodiesterase